MSDQEWKHFLPGEGKPTAPDVEELLKAFPDLKIGDRIEYSAIKDLNSTLKHDYNRWKTVTDKWRRRLEEKGLVLKCDDGKAFYVASAKDVAAATYGTLQTIGRKARKQRRHLSIVAPENDQQRAEIAHHGRLLHMLEKDVRKTKMNVLPPASAKSLPQASPPTQPKQENEK